MEKLKKELQEKGYTFFKMQDYDEFKDDYEYYKKYICNSEKNLLEYIDSVKMSSVSSIKTDEYEIGQAIQIQKQYQSFEDAYSKTSLYFNDTNPYFLQYWFFGAPGDITNEFKKILNKIAMYLYGVEKSEIYDIINLTYYPKECSLKQHRDGKSNDRLCAILIYLNDEDYKSEWGGNIIFEGKESVTPIYGNVAVLDFKNNNALHEVQKVIDGYGRYAILSFVNLINQEQSTNNQSMYNNLI